MELALIAIAIVLIFKQKILESLAKNTPLVLRNAESLTKYLGSSAVLTLTISLVPKLYMIIYMRDQGFYAYEIFGSGAGGYSVLVGNIFFNYIITTFGLFGTAVLFAGGADRWLVGLVATVNALLIAYFVLLAVSLGTWGLVFVTLAISLALASYLYYWVSHGIEGKARVWFAPLLLSFFLLIAPFFYTQGVILLIKSALAQMKVGAMLVQVRDMHPLRITAPDEKPVWLVLRTPEALYIREAQDRGPVAVLRAEHVIVVPASK